jgi:hypothetical protein
MAYFAKKVKRTEFRQRTEDKVYFFEPCCTLTRQDPLDTVPTFEHG